MSLLPGSKAPRFVSKCYENGKFRDFDSESMNGKWFILFFYPVDFGHISPNELVQLEKFKKKLDQLGCEIVAVSRDNVVVHERFVWLDRAHGGIRQTNDGFFDVFHLFGVSFPLCGDMNSRIANKFKMMTMEHSVTFRGYFIIDPQQTIRARVVSDFPVGIDIGEIVNQVNDLVANTFTEDDLDFDRTENLANKIKDALLHFDPSPNNSYYVRYLLEPDEYNLYNEGRRQSPVNIRDRFVVSAPEMGPVVFRYQAPWELFPELYSPEPTVLLNTGMDLTITVPEQMEARVYHQGPYGPLQRDQRLFKVQIHWGSSEHAINGFCSYGEIQFVHYNVNYDITSADIHEDGKCIVSVLLTLDKYNPNQELTKLSHILPKLKERGSTAITPEPISLAGLLPASRDYYTYRGSLTQPPFSENVTWIVMREPVGMHPRVLDDLKQLKHDGEGKYRIWSNARPLNRLYERTVRQWVEEELPPATQV